MNLGPRNQPLTRRPQGNRLQGIPHGKGRGGLTMGIHQRAIREGIYPTIKVSICFTILLYQKEGWEAMTSTRLLKVELPDCQEPIPPPVNPGTN